MGMFFALLSLHVAWMSYFLKMPTGSNSSSILKQEVQLKIKLSSQSQRQPKNMILHSQLQKFQNLLYFLRESKYQKVIMTQFLQYTVRRLHHRHSMFLIDSNQDTKQRMQRISEISSFKRRVKKMLERLKQSSLLPLVMNSSNEGLEENLKMKDVEFRLLTLSP